MTALRPQWAWELTGARGEVLDRPLSPVFPTRFDAEEWLGLQWRALRDQGVHGAGLRNDGAAVPPVHDLTGVPEQMTWSARA
ncbi:hypothetical protein KQI48_10495 [Cellulomonas hominis]|uniref:Uncharacterized protein n=1 Tax=Cellulomonas hominis TaxID=156981 RepID=A0A511FFV9_9CELL|nr:hypothetical protein [Cellulomonas hominis]MBB5475454.1 hypothetical protein [Cellulomonas hominis]MBU5423093.1 hypothetical protein [Cellulomonas hominis]NKY10549.1 hypothetical protein [Cellulomonas hominis]GEL48130.1 hypothetical protein CHO01_32460 [Cellulomonas hominis]